METSSVGWGSYVDTYVSASVKDIFCGSARRNTSSGNLPTEGMLGTLGDMTTCFVSCVVGGDIAGAAKDGSGAAAWIFGGKVLAVGCADRLRETGGVATACAGVVAVAIAGALAKEYALGDSAADAGVAAVANAGTAAEAYTLGVATGVAAAVFADALSAE